MRFDYGRRHLVLLAQNQTGLNNLFKLVSESYKAENFYRYPRIDYALLKKYNEGIVDMDGYTWGLSPGELVKNFAVVILVIFSTQVLGFFDGILVAIEGQYRGTAPALLPLQMQDIPLEEDVSLFDAASSAMTLLYEALVTPLYGFKILAFILSTILWILDLFIYPLFLAERFFLLGIMQAFFPLVISLAVFEKFRSLAYNFFKLSNFLTNFLL